jgi:hypothetical protein
MLREGIFGKIMAALLRSQSGVTSAGSIRLQ